MQRFNYYTQKVGDTPFTVLSRYQDLTAIGSGELVLSRRPYPPAGVMPEWSRQQEKSGAQGVVISAFDTVRRKKVAIKKLVTPFRNETYTKRAFRELRLMQMVSHKKRYWSL